MYNLPPNSKLARTLEEVASAPPSTPFVLVSPSGQASAVGTRLTVPPAPGAQGVVRAYGQTLLETFLSPLAVFGVPVAASVELFRNASARISPGRFLFDILASQRFENWKLRRAFGRPYFLRSTVRGSRVRKPPCFSTGRRLGS